ncbi:hypothetical protein ACTU3I_08055 [Microbacterium sp. RD1]|uniref:hypothetical protein n=1 Tax=Microbacterium sp. RD1 TaxID=3457313 RepID=UPI003FA5A0EE
MEALEGWSEFNVAMVGATAALAGLVIVAASVNIADIVKEASLTARLGAAIAALILALSGSAIGLIPRIPVAAYGIAVLVLALMATMFAAVAARRVYQNRRPANRFKGLRSAVSFLPAATYVVGAALLLGGAAGAGLVVFAVGSVVAVITALVVSWIVLVEVLR